MNIRIKKKKVKLFLEWFTKEKTPYAFYSENDRKQYISILSRNVVGQRGNGLRVTRIGDANETD